MTFSTPAPLAVGREGVIRFLLAAQGLDGGPRPDPARPAGPAAVLHQIRRLECVQIDPVAAVERNQHLVLAARLPGYRPATLNTLLSGGRVFEYMANAACVIPIEDYPIFEGTRRRYRRRYAAELAMLRPAVRRIQAALEADGPLPARAFDTDHRVHGWWDNTHPKTKATSHALNLLLRVGAVTVVKRAGLARAFDLAERVVPPHLMRAAADLSTADADEAMLEKYLRAYRLVDAGDARFGWRAMDAAARRVAIRRRIDAGAVVPLAVEGVARPYFVMAEDVDALRRADRAAQAARSGAGARPADDALATIRFLPPLDNLLWRRERIADLFGFRYTWEVYQPPSKRRFGYYTMPILCGTRLIGRIDPRLDRDRGRLVVIGLHLEPAVRATRLLKRRLDSALEAFARFHGARDVRIGHRWHRSN